MNLESAMRDQRAGRSSVRDLPEAALMVALTLAMIVAGASLASLAAPAASVPHGTFAAAQGPLALRSSPNAQSVGEVTALPGSGLSAHRDGAPIYAHPAGRPDPSTRTAPSAVSGSGSSSRLITGGVTGIVYPTLAPASPVYASAGSGAVLAAFPGINQTWSNCDCIPPDVTVGAGPTDVVEMTHFQVAVYSKSGTLVTNESLWKFFATTPATSPELVDPRVLYDNLSGRWFASVLNFTADTIKVAVSTSSDPGASWFVYGEVFSNVSELPDQPYLGVSSTLVGLSANAINTTTSAVDGSEYWVINKTAMLAGAVAYYHLWGPISPGGGPFYANARAVQSLTPGLEQWFDLINPSPSDVAISVVGVPPADPIMSANGAAIAPVSQPPLAVQPGSSYSLNTSDGRILSAVWSNGVLTSTAVTGCASLSCVRLDQLFTTTYTLLQDTNLSSSDYLFDPAVAVDSNGDLAIIVGYSSATVYPSLEAAILLGNQSGEVDTWIPIVSGDVNTTALGCTTQFGCPYGDYFGAATDPATGTFWVAGEYLSTAGGLWSTYLADLAVPLETTVPTAALNPVDVGVSTSWATSPSGGAGSFSYIWLGLPAGCSSQDNATLTCTPTSPGSYDISVNVTDSAGQSVQAGPVLFLVHPPPAAKIVPVRPSSDVGQVANFSAQVTGGTVPFQYVWSGMPPGACGAGNGPLLTCTFSAPGPTNLSINVTDHGGGFTTSPTLTFHVYSAPTISVPTATPDPGKQGSQIQLTVAAAGGTGGFSYTWTGLPAGCTSVNSSTLSCTPSTSGTFDVRVTATDANGVAVTSPSLSLDVHSNASTGLLGIPGLLGWLLLAVLAAVVIGVLVFVALRRRRRSIPPSPMTPYAGPLPPSSPATVVPAGATGAPPAPPPPSAPWEEGPPQ